MKYGSLQEIQRNKKLHTIVEIADAYLYLNNSLLTASLTQCYDICNFIFAARYFMVNEGVGLLVALKKLETTAIKLY